MELTLKRIALKEEYTIGKLYVNGVYECDSLEDKVLDLTKEKKVYGKTAIPSGRYNITLGVQSPKYSKREFYMNTCGGYLPRLLNVPHFEGILLHCADGYKGADLVEGCIGIGQNKIKGGLLNGKETFIRLYDKLKKSDIKGEEIWITIM